MCNPDRTNPFLTGPALLFFNDHPGALPIYTAFAGRLCRLFPGGGVTLKVQKTQLTFANRHGFAFVSFLPALPAGRRPNPYLTVSFGLGEREISPRIAAASEPYPGRWTHHVVLARPEDADDELMAWVSRAAAFALAKGRGAKEKKEGQP